LILDKESSRTSCNCT